MLYMHVFAMYMCKESEMYMYTESETEWQEFIEGICKFS